MIVLGPWLAAIGVALLSTLTVAEAVPERRRKSVEACVGNCTAMWIVEDGVLRVYAEETHLDCTRIVVECSVVPAGIPGEVDGHPVRIRVDERMGEEEAAEQKAARLFAQVVTRARYDLKASRGPDGRVSTIRVDPEHGRASLMVEGTDISPDLRTQATWISEVVGDVRPSFRHHPALGPGTSPFVLVTFERVD